MRIVDEHTDDHRRASVMLFYAGPMVIWALLNAASGGTTAGNAGTSPRSVLLAWGTHATGGILLVLLAEPLAQVVTRGFDDRGPAPPTA